MPSKLRELLHELSTVLSGQILIDVLLPSITFFILVAAANFGVAVWGAVALSICIVVWRRFQRQSLGTALIGLLTVMIAAVLSRLLGRDEGYFLPSIVTGFGTVLLCAVSIVAGRPMVAWTSHLSRRWPRAWYWHPQVRPAYTEVTWFWLIFFLLRTLLQLSFFQSGEVIRLAGLNLLLEWPATIVLLVVSYLYGSWRLRNLGGPSVAEFKEGAQPPWQSQLSGF